MSATWGGSDVTIHCSHLWPLGESQHQDPCNDPSWAHCGDDGRDQEPGPAWPLVQRRHRHPHSWRHWESRWETDCQCHNVTPGSWLGIHWSPNHCLTLLSPLPVCDDLSAGHNYAVYNPMVSQMPLTSSVMMAPGTGLVRHRHQGCVTLLPGTECAWWNSLLKSWLHTPPRSSSNVENSPREVTHVFWRLRWYTWRPHWPSNQISLFF